MRSTAVTLAYTVNESSYVEAPPDGASLSHEPFIQRDSFGRFVGLIVAAPGNEIATRLAYYRKVPYPRISDPHRLWKGVIHKESSRRESHRESMESDFVVVLTNGTHLPTSTMPSSSSTPSMNAWGSSSYHSILTVTAA